MKTRIILLLLAMVAISSCELIDTIINKDSSSSISGTTSIPINTVGNTFATSVMVGSTYFNANATVTITSIADGVDKIHVVSNIPSTLAAQVPAKYKDSSGKLVYDLKVKMTDKGILDYQNMDHEPFVLVKYDAKVGDKYTLEKSNGTTITREVVRKSTDDDYYWGGMLIKTTDVEQDSRIPGVKKIEYFTNHKFGLVGIRVYMEDGTSSQVGVSPSTY
jgi:hypothetical protein